MGFEDFVPIFGEPKVEWAAHGSSPLCRFLFHVYAPDSSHVRINVTDFHSSTWEANQSVMQLEDMRDNIGIGGSWSEFMDYVVNSMKSEDVKLILEGTSNSDGAAYAKLYAQRSKGMPLIIISLTKLMDSAASKAMANLSLGLFIAFKSIQCSLVEEQQHSFQLTKVISAEKERNETFQRELEQYSKKQKFQKINDLEKADVSISNNLQSSAARDTTTTKVTNRVVPARRRAKVRGALLRDSDDNSN
ncbi:U2 small nuclear ribonucleoprotein auxiliary factor-like protein [Quillaja saponaria]|uniref:U2 small nuclear ribonucleoprotein auxiliary factor-like protein n=1 Tax=Quillaja saponaria TaxID=32244 RepID=A0AAD7KSI8_QUISA|nr:U2 small nuclear ribonucleoprotein auxiliary factor-like protein [Quillaja saponaria]